MISDEHRAMIRTDRNNRFSAMLRRADRTMPREHELELVRRVGDLLDLVMKHNVHTVEQQLVEEELLNFTEETLLPVFRE